MPISIENDHIKVVKDPEFEGDASNDFKDVVAEIKSMIRNATTIINSIKPTDMRSFSTLSDACDIASVARSYWENHRYD
jgi:hypothetical protein